MASECLIPERIGIISVILGIYNYAIALQFFKKHKIIYDL